jgi:hypothetical protein
MNNNEKGVKDRLGFLFMTLMGNFTYIFSIINVNSFTLKFARFYSIFENLVFTYGYAINISPVKEK